MNLSDEAALIVRTESPMAEYMLVHARAGITINNDEEYRSAANVLREVVTKRKLLEEKRKAILDPAKRVIDEINALFKPTLAAWTEIEGGLRRAVAAYQVAVDERASVAAEQARAFVAQAGPSPTVAQTITYATLAQAAVTTAPATEGLSSRDVLKWDVADEAHVPREFLSVDGRKIAAAMKRGVTSIPGIRFFTERSLIQRR